MLFSAINFRPIAFTIYTRSLSGDSHSTYPGVNKTLRISYGMVKMLLWDRYKHFLFQISYEAMLGVLGMRDNSQNNFRDKG